MGLTKHKTVLEIVKGSLYRQAEVMLAVFFRDKLEIMLGHVLEEITTLKWMLKMFSRRHLKKEFLESLPYQ